MPIRMVSEKGRTGPRVFCDHCGKQIASAEDGNVEWLPDDAESGGAEPFFTHKACCNAFEQSRGGKEAVWYASELNEFPIRLAANLQMPIDTRETEGLSYEYVLRGRLFDIKLW